MSGIQLSQELFDGLRHVVARQSPEAREDDGVVMQYLAAAVGYMLAGQQIDTARKREFLDELLAFSRHVFDDTEQHIQARRQARSTSAFGYWEPPK